VNYLGNFDQVDNLEGMLLRPLRARGGIDRPGGMRRDWPLELDAFIADGVLEMRWSYSRALHDEATIARLAAEVRRALGELAAMS
jgi:non-ribosomal peptide synthase protein (TIGR01720 family)